MLRGIVEDIAFHNPSSTVVGDIGYTPDLDGYFVNKQTIVDARTTRLPITYQNQVMDYNSFYSYVMSDIYQFVIKRHYLDPTNTDDIAVIQILLDDLMGKVNNQMTEGTSFTVDRSMGINLYYDQETLENSDNNYIGQMSQSDYNGLFNIIERLSLGILYQQSQSDINAILVGSTSTYYGYKAGSLVITNKRLLAHVYDGVDIDVIVMPEVEFTITKLGGYEMTVKLWFSRTFFEQYYPFSSVVQVIPPSDLSKLLDLDVITTGYKGLFESRETIDELLSPHIVYGTSHSGFMSITIPYVSPSTGVNQDTKFSILYNGAEPTVLVIKQAIRDYLLASGIGTEELWRDLYPTLFIDNAYYIFPIWDETFSTANRTNFRSILSEQKRLLVLNKIGLFNTHVDQSDMSILNAAYNASFAIALSDISNTSSTPLVNQFSDYIRITPSNEIYNLLSDETKQFITLYNKALAKANGETNELETITLEGYKYVRFTISNKEFMVLTKNSYNALMY